MKPEVHQYLIISYSDEPATVSSCRMLAAASPSGEDPATHPPPNYTDVVRHGADELSNTSHHPNKSFPRKSNAETRPVLGKAAPGKNDTAPGKGGTAHGNSGNVPGKSETEPFQGGTTPKGHDGSEQAAVHTTSPETGRSPPISAAERLAPCRPMWQHHILSSLRNLFDDSESSDVCILLGDSQIYAHSIILNLNSKLLEVDKDEEHKTIKVSLLLIPLNI